MRTSNSRHLPSSSSPLVARFDWRVASLLRQLHAQILGEGTSSSSSLISPTLFSILIGVQSPDSSFLVLSSFRLPHTEELLLKSTALSSSSRSLSPLEEALCRDLLTLSSLLPRGLQILGLLFHNASSLSSEKNFSSLQSTPGPDGEKKAEGGKEGKKKEHYDHVAGKNVHAFSPLSGVSLLKKCVDLLNQTEDLGFCLDFPRGEGKRYGGCKRKTQHGGEEEKDFFCLLGRLPSSSSSSLSSSSMSDGVDAEEQQLRIKESIVDACLATPSSTDAIPWIFSTVLFSSLNKSFTSSSSSSSLSCSLPFPKISVEDGASILKTEKSVFLRSQITFEFSFDLPYAVKKRVEPGRCDGCGKNGWKRQDGERDEGSSGRTDKLIDKHEGRDNEEAVSAEGEDLEDFLVEMSPSLGEEILHQLRRQEEMITKSPKSLFFCMPNGVYVHPTGDDLEEEDEMDVRKRDDEKRKKPSKKDDETPHTLWSAVCTAAKKCGSSVAISSSSPANNSSLSLPWFEQEKNNTSTTSTQKTLSSSSSSIPFSLSSLSVLPIPAFLNSVSLLEYGSETRSYDDLSPPLPSDSECMYTPVRCTTTYPSSPPSDKNRRGKNDSFKSLAAVGMESKLDVCIFMPGSASLTSVANALRFAFLCQIRQLGLEIASSIICRNERKEEEQHQGDIIMMNGENLISGVSPAQAAGEVIFSSNFPDVSEDPSLLFSFPLLPRFLSPLSPSFCHNDQDSLQLQGDREKKSKTTSSSRGNCSGVTTPQGEKTSSQTRLNGTESDLSSLYQSITSTTGLISLNFSLIRTLHACHPFVLGGYLHSRTLRRRWIEVIGNGKISPALRPSAVVPWNECERYASGKLLNPHASLCGGPKWMRSSSSSSSSVVLSLVPGDLLYYHYNQDREHDEGWGCCYRSLQLVFSWFKLQHYTDKPIPSIREIQEVLKKNDMAHENLQLGSRTWIGTVEGSYIFNWELHVSCKLIYLAHATELSDHSETLHRHFDEVGTPAMMGVGDYAYTMLGVCTDRKTGETAYLIADPHYPGEDLNELDKILDKGWIAWKKAQFFEKTAGTKHMNIALAQISTEDGMRPFL